MRLGIVGAGQVLHDAYMPILPFLDCIESVCVYDTHPPAVAELRRLFVEQLDSGGFEKDYAASFPDASARAQKFLGRLREATSLSDLIGASDAILVCTPPRTHIAVALEAALMGRLVITEKPLATSTVDLRDLEKREIEALETHLRYMENYLFNPALTTLRAKIESGALGALQLVEVSLENRGPAQWRDRPLWRTDTSSSGGGALLDLGPHTLALGLFLSGISVADCTAEAVSVQFATGQEEREGLRLERGVDIASEVALRPLKGQSPLVVLRNAWHLDSWARSMPERFRVLVVGTHAALSGEIVRVGGRKVFRVTEAPRGELPRESRIPVQFPHDSFFFGLRACLESEATAVPAHCRLSFGVGVLQLLSDVLARAAPRDRNSSTRLSLGV